MLRDHASPHRSASCTLLINGAAGNWNVAGNWSGGVVPNNGVNTFNVKIDNGNAGQNSTVTLNINATIDNLTVDSGDQLTIQNAQSLIIAGGVNTGTITNNGTIALSSTGGSTDLRLTTTDVTLQGTGKVTLSDASNNFILDLTPGANTLTNAAGHTIEGAGQLGANTLNLVNAGLIDANVASANKLTIAPSAGGVTNNGTLRANAGSTLTVTDGLTNFSGTTLTGGAYQVLGTMRLPAATDIITNAATILLDGAGSQLLAGAVAVNALANFATNAAAGNFTIQNGRNFTTTGDFTNAGMLTVGMSSTFKVKSDGSGTLANTGTQALSRATSPTRARWLRAPRRGSSASPATTRRARVAPSTSRSAGSWSGASTTGSSSAGSPPSLASSTST